MPFIGNAASFGRTRQGAAHAAREFNGTVAAGTTETVGPLRCQGMPHVILTMNQSTSGAAGVAIATIQYRVKATWSNLKVNIASIAGQPVTVSELLPGAREVRVQITTSGASDIALVATLGVIQGA